jgi:DNA-binding response OmpR family regulator
MGNRFLSQQPYVIIVERREVDDSFLQFNCRRAGCEVEVASSGDDFVRLTDARLPDVFSSTMVG